MTLASRPLPVGPRIQPLPGVARSRPALGANATLAAREDVTATLAAFTIVLDQPLITFNPGQYVSVGVFEDRNLTQRPYSVVDLDVSRTRLELFIRRLPDGVLSNLLWAQPLGARVRVGPARGLFTLDWADPRPRVMIGTGTGLAPLLSMLDALAQRADRQPNVLIHGASYHRELAYRARLESWIAGGLPIDYRPTVSRHHDQRNIGWAGLTGRAETQLGRLLDQEPAMRDSVAYLCGNPDMIEACSAVLVDCGFAPADIRVEQFHAPVVVRKM